MEHFAFPKPGGRHYPPSDRVHGAPLLTHKIKRIDNPSLRAHARDTKVPAGTQSATGGRQLANRLCKECEGPETGFFPKTDGFPWSDSSARNGFLQLSKRRIWPTKTATQKPQPIERTRHSKLRSQSRKSCFKFPGQPPIIDCGH